jgi:ATP-binding cassette subfamily F protein uup
LSLLISPKSRIGLLGANGTGKSTLIKILLGELKPDTGSVTHAERLKAAYFEQNRESLDPQKTLIDTICPKGEWVDYQGQKVHAKGYLSRFLFSYEQMGLAVGKLSGGEQSRLCLARLMLTEANVLVLDEPTNDLDMATLDVLSEVLKEFNGAVILVTHDRYFLDQVANQIISFGVDSEGAKELTFLAGLDQWEIWFEEQKSNNRKKPALKQNNHTETVTVKKRLGHKEQRELAGMESKIQETEKKFNALQLEIAKPENASNAVKLLELSKELQKTQVEIERLYARWAELS